MITVEHNTADKTRIIKIKLGHSRDTIRSFNKISNQNNMCRYCATTF
jgi:hypothetical protein